MDDECEGNVAAVGNSNYTPSYVYSKAQEMVDRTNNFIENISDNIPFGNELAYVNAPDPYVPQCLPIRFLFKGVYYHCNTDDQSVAWDHLQQYYINPSTEINIMVTSISTGATGFTYYFYNGFVVQDIAWIFPSAFVHEVGHIAGIYHPFESPETFSDTWNSSYSWDHDCNPSTQSIYGDACWSDITQYEGQDACPGSFCSSHPCCGWAWQNTNIMSYSGWASNENYGTISPMQVEAYLTGLATRFCDKIEAIDPLCPPPSAIIDTLPLEGQGTDCSFCIRMDASSNENRHKLAFYKDNNGTLELHNQSGWIEGEAGQYCINLIQTKPNSNTYHGGYIAGGKYVATVIVQNECGVSDTATLTFTVPAVKSCYTANVTLEPTPNPATNEVTLEITTSDTIANAVLYFTHAVYGPYGVSGRSVGQINPGSIEEEINISTWYTGINYALLITEYGIFSTAIIKD